MRKTKGTASLPDLYWVEQIVKLMDSRFRIPGTQIRFGLDPVLGLFPGLGDLAAFAISGGLILYMLKFGASRKVIILMLLNITLDATIGSIPIFGNIFDIYYKANSRNIRLLNKHYQEGRYQGSGTGVILIVAFIIILLMFLMVWAIWHFISWMISMI